MKSLLLKILTGLYSLSASATHLTGGELFYDCLDPVSGTYQITLYLYKDCTPGTGNWWFDEPIYAGIYKNSDNTLIGQAVNLPLIDSIRLENHTFIPCKFEPPQVCIDRATYQTTIVMPPQTDGYTIMFQNCCRNTNVVNMVNPFGVGSSWEMNLPDAATSDPDCNSSPRFNNNPLTILCVNENFTYDNSATDSDGDSLVYGLCAPKMQDSDSTFPPANKPVFADINYSNGYSASNPLGASSTISIDSQTGVMNLQALDLGRFLVGVCVEEWDRTTGQLKSTLKLDLEFNVALCDSDGVVADFTTNTSPCDPEVNFENHSYHGQTYLWDFGVSGSTSDTSNIKHPVFSFPAPGSYTVTLTTNPGHICEEVHTEEIFVDSCAFVGVKEPDNKAVKINPNPSNGVVYFNFTSRLFSRNFDLKIFDLQGRVVYQEQNIPTAIQQIDLRDQAPGIYFWQRIDMEGQIHSGKVILE